MADCECARFNMMHPGYRVTCDQNDCVGFGNTVPRSVCPAYDLAEYDAAVTALLDLHEGVIDLYTESLITLLRRYAHSAKGSG